jgi:hypothetical protein
MLRATVKKSIQIKKERIIMVRKVKKTLGRLSAVDKWKMFMSVVVAVMSMSAFTGTASAASGGAASTFVDGMLDILETVLIAIGGGLGIWGIVNLLEGYGNDNAGAKSQGMKQLMAGVGVALVGIIGIPLLKTFVGTFW